MSESFDVIVLGGGTAGLVTASGCARLGRKVALIEREALGGDCLWTGCVPTKALIASAKLAHQMRNAAAWGLEAVTPKLSPRSIMESMREQRRVISRHDDPEKFRKLGIDVIEGSARLVSNHEVEVGNRRLSAKDIVIATGARTSIPPVEGLEEHGFLDHVSFLNQDAFPPSLLILGGGYIGIEFAQMFRRFGSRVTVVERGAQLLPVEDEDIAGAVLGVLREDGVEVLLQAEAGCAERFDGGQVRMTVRVAAGDRMVVGSHVLLAAGRVPNTDRLDPSAAGIDTDARGFIRVNERLETSAAGVYALGDVKGGPAFTHISYDDYRIVRDNLLHGGRRTTGDRPVPYTVFMDPQLGRIGLTEREARKAGRRYRLATLPMSAVARALEMDEPRGVMKVLVDPDSGQLLGAAVLGVEGGELMTALQLAMMGGLPYDRLSEAVFAHPTLMESFNNLFSTLE